MYFLWKRTPNGSIRVSCDGFSGFVNLVLSGKSRCRSVSLAEGENAAVTLVLSLHDSAADCLKIEERLASIIAPLGLRVKVIWTEMGADTEWCESLSSVYMSPWTWMFLAALIALGIMAGCKGFFWTIFWGTAAWFVSKFIIFIITRRKMSLFSHLTWR